MQLGLLKRPALRTAVVLSFSLATTVSAAWYLAFENVRSPGEVAVRQVTGADASAFVLSIVETPGCVSLTWYRSPGSIVLVGQAVGWAVQDPPGIPILDLRVVRADLAPEAAAPRWARPVALPWVFGKAAWPRPTERDWRQVEARGWPFLALYFERGRAANWAQYTRGGLTLPLKGLVGVSGDLFLHHEHPVILPLRPVWSGLAADTLLFGAAWWLVLLAPAAARRAWRRRRGVCSACGYSLSGLPRGAPLRCPECGKLARGPAGPA